MATKSGYAYATDVDLTKLLVARLQKERIHPDSLAGLAQKKQNEMKEIEPDKLASSELEYRIGDSVITIMTVNRGPAIKTQTATLINPDIWAVYGYCNETGEAGQLVYNKGEIRTITPEEAIDEFVRKAMGN